MSKLNEIKVEVKPEHPFAYGDTLMFNLPLKTQQAIKTLILEEVIGEDEKVKITNPHSECYGKYTIVTSVDKAELREKVVKEL